MDEIDTAEDMQEIARKQWQKRAQRSSLIIDTIKEAEASAPSLKDEK